MFADDEKDDENMNRKEFELRLERFLDHSRFYSDRLPLLKIQLNGIDRLNQPDLYIQILNEIGKIIHDLAKNLRNIEQLHSRLNENERLKLDQQIHLLRIEIDREMNEFHRLREQFAVSSLQENNLVTDESFNNNLEENSMSNELRQRHIATNRVNDSYDLLEQDLASLREAIDEVATLVAQQKETLSRTNQFTAGAEYRVRNVSSFFQKAAHNRYVTVASGAVVGASVAGPIGFIMGTKVGILVVLTGSALGALSMNIMHQKVSETEESQADSTAYNQAML